MQWLALIGLSLASFITAVDFAIVNTALPAIQKGLVLTTTQLQWVMNIFVLTICIFMATMGRISDIFGHKKVLYVSIILFGISSFMAGFAHSACLLILARALQGLSVASIIPSSLALISIIFKERHGKAIGVWTSINGIGMALGPALGGLIVNAFSWRWIFLMNIPFVIASLMICHFTIRTKISKKQGEKIDWLGFFCLAFSIGSLVFALINGDHWGWFSAHTLLLILFSVLVFIIFIQIEKKHAQPLLDFKLFKTRLFFAAAIVNFLILFFAYSVFFLAPLYLQNIRELLPYLVGFMLLPISAMVIIVSPYGGYLYDHYQAKLPFCLGVLLFGSSALLQAFITLDTSYVYIAFSFALMGIAWGLSAGPASAAGIAALPKQFAGIASGALWTIRNLGGSLGLAFSGAIFHLQSQTHITRYLTLAQIHLSAFQQKNMAEHLTNPDLALSLVDLHTDSSVKILGYLKNGFIHGYQSTMLFLALVSLVSFFIIVLLIPRIKGERHD